MTRGDVSVAEWELIEPFVPAAVGGRLPPRLREQFNGVTNAGLRTWAVHAAAAIECRYGA